MYGGGSEGDRNFADFQAKLLGSGQPRREDPVEQHMNRVKRLVFRWTAAQIVITGAALWISGIVLAVALSAGATFLAGGAIVAMQRRRHSNHADAIPRIVL
jgi:hypothetical protein